MEIWLRAGGVRMNDILAVVLMLKRRESMTQIESCTLQSKTALCVNAEVPNVAQAAGEIECSEMSIYSLEKSCPACLPESDLSDDLLVWTLCKRHDFSKELGCQLVT